MTFIHGVTADLVLDGARAVRLSNYATIGLVGTAPDAPAADFPLDTPVVVRGPQGASALGANGSLPDALDGIFDQGAGTVVIVRVDDGADEAATLAKVAGDSAQQTGVHALLTSQAVLGVTPKILVATGWTHQRPGDAANPVAAELKAVADRLRAVFYVDGPNTDDAATIAVADETGDPRGRVIDPFVLVSDGTGGTATQPASARVAGRRAALDGERGFWHSVSNQPLDGVIGLGRPIVFETWAGSQTNTLNENNITTLIRRDGFRVWGNSGTGAEPLTRYQSVLRTQDVVMEALETQFAWASDRPLSSQLVLDIADGVNAAIRELVALGALLGGRCWPDEELNTKESLRDGQLYLNVEIEPPAPLRHLAFKVRRNADYYAELVGDVISLIDQA